MFLAFAKRSYFGFTHLHAQFGARLTVCGWPRHAVLQQGHLQEVEHKVDKPLGRKQGEIF